MAVNNIGDPIIHGTTEITLAETTTPSNVATYGKVYTKSNNRLFFQDGAGVEHEVVEVDVEHGEFYMDSNGTALTVTTVDDPVAMEGFSSSHLADFTFVASKNGVITGTSNSGGQLRIADVGHGLTTGDIVTINGLTTAAQNGITTITTQGVDAFDCDDISYATSAETGTWQMGSYLLTPTGGAGTYVALFASSATSAGANKTFLIELCIDTTPQTDMKVERKFSAADIGSIGMSGLITVVATNRIWLVCTGLTDATNITFKHADLCIHRV